MYPAELSLTVLICGVGSMMSGSVALVAERGNAQAWAIGFDIHLFTVVYAVSLFYCMDDVAWFIVFVSG